jgi:hypothetical protein
MGNQVNIDTKKLSINIAEKRIFSNACSCKVSRGNWFCYICRKKCKSFILIQHNNRKEGICLECHCKLPMTEVLYSIIRKKMLVANLSLVMDINARIFATYCDLMR